MSVKDFSPLNLRCERTERLEWSAAVLCLCLLIEFSCWHAGAGKVARVYQHLIETKAG